MMGWRSDVSKPLKAIILPQSESTVRPEQCRCIKFPFYSKVAAVGYNDRDMRDKAIAVGKFASARK